MWTDNNSSSFAINVCRLCANTSEVIAPIFSKDDNEGNDEGIDMKIKKCLPINIVEDDMKPKYICFGCISKLEVCSEFYEQTLAADGKFDSLLETGYTAEEELELQTQKEAQDTVDDTIINTSTAVMPKEVSLTGDELVNATETDVMLLGKMDSEQVVQENVEVQVSEQITQDIVFMVELKYKDEDPLSYSGDSQQPKTYTLAYTAEGKEVTRIMPGKVKALEFPDTPKGDCLIYECEETPEKEQEESVGVLKSLDMMEMEKNQEKVPSKSCTDKPFSCPLCMKTYMRRATLNAHMAVHTQIRPHVCNKCGASFVLRWDLTLHLRIHNNTFACVFCNKAFSVQNKLERHIRTHTGERPFACSICGKAFGDKNNLQSHERTHSSDRPFSCETCGRGFRVRSHLTEHYKVHSQVAAYTCDVCGKRFKWKTNLNIHLKVHNGERFPCDECGREFSRQSDLSKHKRNHTGDRPHVCSICDKKYADKAILQKHLISHSDTKPYSCDVCNKSFHFQWYLNSHKKTHRNTSKPLGCDQCPRIFYKKNLLVLHSKEHELKQEPMMDEEDEGVETWLEVKEDCEEHLVHTVSAQQPE